MRPQIKTMTPWQTEFQKRTKERRTVYFSKLSQNTTSTPPKPQQPRRRNTYHIWIMLIGLYRDHTEAERRKLKSQKSCDSVGIVSQPFRLFQHLFKFTSDSFKEPRCATSREQMTSLSLLSRAFPTHKHTHTHTRCFFPKPILFSFCPHESIEQNVIPVAPLWRSKRNTRRRHRGPRPAQRNKLWTCAVSSSFLWQSCSS